jgi:[ribosomal protein S18]-alanine N-acetyltransferase
MEERGRKRQQGSADSPNEETLLRLQSMQASDLPQVVQIEQGAFPFPWSTEAFHMCLQAGVCCWVLERHGVVEAYGVMSIEADKAHILNLCVRPASQRRGLGSKLLAHLLTLARSSQADPAVLEVRPSNVAALKLYKSMGFNVVGMRKRYYEAVQGREDALIMERQLKKTHRENG